MNSWLRVAADRPGVGDHRDGAQPHPREGAQIGDEHAVVGMPRAGVVEIERVGILHQEFARAHGAESRPHLVAKLPLQVIEIERQILVGAHIGAEDLGDHLLVGRTVEHLALVAVLDAQHLLAVVVVAAALAPQLGGLDGRHQHLDRAGAVLLLAHDAADLLQHAKAEREKRVDARGLLANHSGAQHQPVRNDLCLLRSFTQDRQKVTGQTHGLRAILQKRGRSESGSLRQLQARQAIEWTSGGGKLRWYRPAAPGLMLYGAVHDNHGDKMD